MELQGNTKNVMRALPFASMARCIVAEEGPKLTLEPSDTFEGKRFQSAALLTLQAGVEHKIMEDLTRAREVATHAKRITVKVRDLDVLPKF
jgi:histone H3/H4